MDLFYLDVRPLPVDVSKTPNFFSPFLSMRSFRSNTIFCKYSKRIAATICSIYFSRRLFTFRSDPTIVGTTTSFFVDSKCFNFQADLLYLSTFLLFAYILSAVHAISMIQDSLFSLSIKTTSGFLFSHGHTESICFRIYGPTNLMF